MTVNDGNWDANLDHSIEHSIESAFRKNPRLNGGGTSSEASAAEGSCASFAPGISVPASLKRILRLECHHCKRDLVLVGNHFFSLYVVHI